MKYIKRLLHVLFFIITSVQFFWLLAVSCSLKTQGTANVDMLIPRIVMYGTIVEVILAIIFKEYVGKVNVWLEGCW